MTNFFRRLRENIRRMSHADRVLLLLSTVIKLSLLNAAVAAILKGDWMVTFVSISAFAATLLPWILARNRRFRFPAGFEFALVLFIYATLFLGEVHGFYTRFWWWDIVLHGGSAMGFGFIGFLVLYSLYRKGKFEAPPSLIVFLSFSLAIAIGVLWEIFEFSMDTIFGFNMQKSGLRDTMWDLIVDAAGGGITSIAGYAYMKYQIIKPTFSTVSFQIKTPGQPQESR